MDASSKTYLFIVLVVCDEMKSVLRNFGDKNTILLGGEKDHNRISEDKKKKEEKEQSGIHYFQLADAK
jgi:hypothetical protein